MPYSEAQIKTFLTIQSHERFAKLFIAESTTKTIVFSKKRNKICITWNSNTINPLI